MPRLLELCCGSKSVSKYFEAQGWECVTVDIDKKFEPTIIADVRDIDPPNTWKAGEFDVVWCSPPCTFFSIARSRAPRDFRSADQIVIACWDIIRHLISDTTKNVFWFMENPATGYLKTRPYMQEFEEEKKTLCYCKYGCPYKKSTNICLVFYSYPQVYISINAPPLPVHSGVASPLDRWRHVMPVRSGVASPLDRWKHDRWINIRSTFNTPSFVVH